MLFKNYGLFWRRENVFWGRGPIAGHLKGKIVGKKRSEPIDFKEQQGVYVLYDDLFRIVYAGQVGAGKNQTLIGRLGQHRDDSLADRWERFSWFGVRSVLKSGKLQKEKTGAHSTRSEVLNHIEAILLAVTEPPQNRQGGRFGAKVQQYLQYRDDDNLGLKQREMIEELYKIQVENQR